MILALTVGARHRLRCENGFVNALYRHVLPEGLTCMSTYISVIIFFNSWLRGRAARMPTTCVTLGRQIPQEATFHHRRIVIALIYLLPAHRRGPSSFSARSARLASSTPFVMTGRTSGLFVGAGGASVSYYALFGNMIRGPWAWNSTAPPTMPPKNGDMPAFLPRRWAEKRHAHRLCASRKRQCCERRVHPRSSSSCLAGLVPLDFFRASTSSCSC